MKRLSVGILSAAALAGLAGSTVAYGWGSSSAGTTAAVSSSRSAERPHAQVVRPGTHFRWAPCVAPAHLEHGVCVTDVVRTVVVPAPAAPAAATPAAPAAPPATSQDATGAAGPAATQEPAEEPGDDHAEEPGEDHDEHGDDDGDHAEAPGN